jgi:hypothetical protein
VLVSRVVGVLSDRPPDSWTLAISRRQTPAVIEMYRRGYTITLGMLCTDPRDLSATLPCVPLFLKNNNKDLLLPGNETVVQPGDRLLFCGQQQAETHMRWTTNNFNALNFVCTGRDQPSGYLWRWLTERYGGQ